MHEYDADDPQGHLGNILMMMAGAIACTIWLFCH